MNGKVRIQITQPLGKKLPLSELSDIRIGSETSLCSSHLIHVKSPLIASRTSASVWKRETVRKQFCTY